MATQTFPVTSHTRHVGPGSTFVVIKGGLHNGLVFIPEAVQKGATRIVTEKGNDPTQSIKDFLAAADVKLVTVKDVRLTLARLSAQAYKYPAKKLKIIGVTGTKGKTTTTYIIEHLLRHSGHKTARMSTAGNRINNDEHTTEYTTPSPDYIQWFLHECVEQDVMYVVMEVSAQALSLSRVHGIEFCSIVFTNFSQEHAEFYASLNDYLAAKKKIFMHKTSGAAVVVNADDDSGREILQEYPSFVPFSLDEVQDIRDTRDGLSFILKHGNSFQRLSTPSLFGSYNISNILASVKIVLAQRIVMSHLANALAQPLTIPGRMDRFCLSNGADCVIDYAHNPASFQAVLSVLRPLYRHMIVVFGAGGERDAKKRPMMGRIAAQFADTVIITNDNPRFEDPKTIAEEIMSGIADKKACKILCELDREKAVKKAYEYSQAGCAIVLLGKGPDEYQLIKGEKIPLSEKKIICELSKGGCL